MFCGKCGKEVSEGASFCGNCGNPVGGSQTGGVAQKSQTGSGKDKKLLYAVIVGAALLAVILVIVVAVKIFDGISDSGKSSHSSGKKTEETQPEKKSKKKKTKLSDIEGSWELCMNYGASVSEILIAGGAPYDIMIGKQSVTLLDGGKEIDSSALSDGDYYVDDDGIGAYHFTAQWYTSKISPAGYRQFRLRIYYAPDDKASVKGEEITGVLHLELYSEEEYITHVIGFSSWDEMKLDEPYTAPAGYYPFADYVLQEE